MWKRIVIVSIFYALFACTIPLNAENSRVSLSVTPTENTGTSLPEIDSKLAKVLLNAEKEKKDLLSDKLYLAEALAGDADVKPDEKYIDLLNDLQIYSKNSLILVSKVLKFSRYFDEEIGKLPVSYEEKLKLRMRLDEVRNSAEKFGILLQKPSEITKKNSCDVLEVNNELEVVILGTGFLDGSRMGTQWAIQKADNAVVTIVAVRPYASAAIVVSGDISRVGPGMEANKTK